MADVHRLVLCQFDRAVGTQGEVLSPILNHPAEALIDERVGLPTPPDVFVSYPQGTNPQEKIINRQVSAGQCQTFLSPQTAWPICKISSLTSRARGISTYFQFGLADTHLCPPFARVREATSLKTYWFTAAPRAWFSCGV